MGRGAHGQSQVGVLGDSGGDRRDAAKKMGTDHQSVFSCRTDRRGCRSPLRCVQGRHHRTDALLRFIIRSRRNHRLKTLSSARNRVSNRIASMCSFLYRTFSPDA